jgi:hypothetical protein
MKKLLIFLILACMVLSGISASAENISQTEDIILGEAKVITIPKPDGEIDEGWVYFNQEFTFIPEESGTYRLLMHYEEDEANPYDVHLDVPGSYLELENGIEFDAVAGESYQLCFQYPNHDGRYPRITFYLGTADTQEIPESALPEDNPKTADAGMLLPLCCLLAATTTLVTMKRKPEIH